MHGVNGSLVRVSEYELERKREAVVSQNSLLGPQDKFDRSSGANE